jgi:hypothetical protein
VTSFARLGSSVSLLMNLCVAGAFCTSGCGDIGSDLSTRNFARLGSTISVTTAGSIGGRLSAAGPSSLSSSVSVRNDYFRRGQVG